MYSLDRALVIELSDAVCSVIRLDIRKDGGARL